MTFAKSIERLEIYDKIRKTSILPVKLRRKVVAFPCFPLNLRFESSVISYGSQTINNGLLSYLPFESSVISYGSQTRVECIFTRFQFESSVISYGSQTL